MERHEIFEMMRALKLAGMRAAYDETMRAGIQHKRAPAEILGDLLKAELAEKTARSVRYQMSAAQFPVMKHLAEFNFDAAPVNEALVRSLHDGDFMDQTRNAVFVGGTGTGKSHLAIAIGVNAVNSRRRVRFFRAFPVHSGS
jgi:DNA replication protein DnaC